MAVLVTGGAGYIGSHTAVALHEAGREVVLLDNFDNSSPAAVDAIRALTTSDMTFVEGDLGIDPFSTTSSRPTTSTKSSTSPPTRRSGECDDPLDYYGNNLGSTIGLAGAMVGTVCASSSSRRRARSMASPTRFRSRRAPTGAESPYGWTKFMSEQILRDVAAAADLDVVLLRYFNPVGAHESGTWAKTRTGSRTIWSRMSCRWRWAGWRRSVFSGAITTRPTGPVCVTTSTSSTSPKATSRARRARRVAARRMHGGQPRHRRGLVRSRGDLGGIRRRRRPDRDEIVDRRPGDIEQILRIRLRQGCARLGGHT